MSDKIFSDEKQEILKTITEVYKEKSINVISTSINEDIGFEKDPEILFNKDEVSKTLGSGFVFIKFTFKEGFKGDIYFIISKSTVAQIVDKMLMGEGDAEFNEAEHIEAIGELTDQILGAVATEYTGLFEFSVSFSQSEPRVIPFSEFETLFVPEDIMAKFTVTVLDTSEAFLILPNQTFQNILDKLQSFSATDTAENEKDNAIKTTTIGTNMVGEVSQGKDLGLLMDVRLPITVELGRKKMFIRDILKLTPGEVVELPKLQGDPVDLFVNGKKFSTGEVVVIGENFGIRIKSLIKPKERLSEEEAWLDD